MVAKVFHVDTNRITGRVGTSRSPATCNLVLIVFVDERTHKPMLATYFEIRPGGFGSAGAKIEYALAEDSVLTGEVDEITEAPKTRIAEV